MKDFDVKSVKFSNKLFQKKFFRILKEKIIVIFPHCLDKSQARKIRRLLLDKGFSRFFSVGGGSQVEQILKDEKPEGVIGVACIREALLGIDLAKQYKVTPQVLILQIEGCKNTTINLEDIEFLDSNKAEGNK